MKVNKTITIGANTLNPITIKRFGYGTMRLTGEMVWGEPKNRTEALQILKTAVERGIRFIDTADFYGEDVTNRLICEALLPYPNDLVVATKVGTIRGKDKSWNNYTKPENLRSSIENNLRTLQVDQIQLAHLRVMPSSDVPFEASLEEMFKMQQEGKIQHVGLSNVSLEELEKALKAGTIASVENAFGYGQRTSFESHGQQYRGLQQVIGLCKENIIPMIPFWSLQNSSSKEGDKISEIAKKYDTTTAQINLAWLLHYDNLMLPIPGTFKLKHFEENLDAFEIKLTEEDLSFLNFLE